MGFKIYDSAAVDCVLCAIPIEEGKSDPFVKLEAAEEAFTATSGIDGEVCRASSHNRLYHGELTIKRSSSHNAQLAAIHAADRASTSGAGVGVFLLRDGNGATMYAGDRCWITKLPPWQFGKEDEDVTWPFDVVINDLAALPGGN